MVLSFVSCKATDEMGGEVYLIVVLQVTGTLVHLVEVTQCKLRQSILNIVSVTGKTAEST